MNVIKRGERESDIVDVQLYQSMPTALEFVFTQIDLVISQVTGPVLDVSNALAMQLHEMADAYQGSCPDQTTDVKMLDLDTNYITLLNSLRRTHPIVYKYIANIALAWHDEPPDLLQQPAQLAIISAAIVDRLAAVAPQAHDQCPPLVATATAAALSSAIPPPAPEPTAEQTAELDKAQAAEEFRQCPAV